MAKTPITPRVVKMDDGRTVEFTGKKRLDKTVEIDGETVKVRLDFENGETRLFTLPASLMLQFAGHGASQKLGDSISDVTDIEDAIETIDQLMGRLNAGDWNAAREGSGTGMAGASILAKALAKLYDKPIAVVREYLSTLDNKTKMALRVTPEVSPIIKQLEDEKAARAAARGVSAPSVDVSSVLAGLKAVGAEAQPA